MEPVFLVVGDTARNPGRSGIQTVVRSLAAALAGLGAPVRLTMWNERLRVLRPLQPHLEIGPGAEPLRDPPGRWPRALWGQPSAWLDWLRAGGEGKFVPIHRHPLHRRAPAGTWVLMPELLYGGQAEQMVEYVHARGWRLAVILYDTIPLQHPEFVPPGLPHQHADYLRAFARADLILPISDASAADWRGFVERQGLPGPLVRTCTLACDLFRDPRVRQLPDAAGTAPGDEQRPVRALCVSTLEARKNHRGLLAAYALAVAARPEVRLELDLVGASYTGAGDLEAAVRAATQALPGLRWHGQLEYDALRALYAECDFTVFPSLVEGFGLPVIESLWFGRPCICADFGVMAENAGGGGCLTVDVRDPQALANAILLLATQPEVRHRLAHEATTRPLKTWVEYAREILDCLDCASVDQGRS